jgi:hypothetical protein
MKSNIKDSSQSLKFMFAGKSVLTFLNTKTGNRFTYKVKKAKDSDIFFVSLLTSPDIYTYIGTCQEGLYKHGKKSTISNEAQSVKVFQYVLNKLKVDNLPDFVEVWHEGCCGKCGRPLTVPQSIETGIGPECLKRLGKLEIRDKFLELILR